MLAAEKPGDPHPVFMGDRERKKHQRLVVGIIGDDDERPQALLFADMPEPGSLEIETLVGRGELRRIFDAHQVNDRVTFEYDTRVYYGQLS